LKDLKTVRPTKEYSTNPNAAAKKKEQDALDALHGEYVKAFVEREQNLEKGMRQMFFKILDDYCTPSMQQQVQMHPDFETKVKLNPIALLELIEQLMHDSVRTSYK